MLFATTLSEYCMYARRNFWHCRCHLLKRNPLIFQLAIRTTCGYSTLSCNCIFITQESKVYKKKYKVSFCKQSLKKNVKWDQHFDWRYQHLRCKFYIISNILTSLLIFVNIFTPWYVDGCLFQLFETWWCPDQPSDQLRSGLKQNKVISQVVTMQPGYIWQSRYKNVGFTKHVAVFMDQVEFWWPLPTCQKRTTDIDAMTMTMIFNW